MDSKRLDDMIMAFGVLNSRQEAILYWTTQTYLLMSMGQPGRMAAQIRRKLDDLQNAPPMGPAHLTPAQLEEIALRELPMMLHVGDEIAQHLEALQRHSDELRAQKLAEAR